MNFTLMPTLKHMAILKVTTELWNLCNIRDLVARLSTRSSDYTCNYDELWKVVEHKIIEKVSELRLPELLKEEILYSNQAMGLEIYKWTTYFCKNHCLGVSCMSFMSPEQFIKSLCVPCWTLQGTAEQKKAAKALIKDDNLDITKRYLLACYFCLEDDIKELWNLLPKTRKAAFYNEGYSSFRIKECTLKVLWTYEIKGKLTQLNGLIKNNTRREISAYRFAFEIVALDGNRTATEYLLQKLTSVEREESIAWYAEYVANRRSREHIQKTLFADVLYFLLSKMNLKQQVKVFEGNPFEVLSCLLRWPWQYFFMEVANRMWNFLSEQDFALILRNITFKMRLGITDFNYYELFAEFWEQGPSTYKKYVTGQCASGLLQDLFHVEDRKNIRLIFKNATVDEREAIVLQEGKNICLFLICSDKWDLLKFFVEVCLSSKDTMIKFKEEFKRHIDCLSVQRTEIEIFTKFFQILDDFISKNTKKRGMEVGTCSPAKKLYSSN